VLESKEKREKRRSEKFCVCDVTVGGCSVSSVSVSVCQCVSGVSVLESKEQRDGGRSFVM
jgi:hypothetical protein